MKKVFCMFFLLLCVVSAFSQGAVPLETGFAGGVTYFEERVAKGTKVVVLNFRSQSPQLSEYIVEELTVHFVNNGFFTVVDRSNLELLQQEMMFQLSGEVSDETIMAVGKKLGAQIIIAGSIEPFGDVYRLRIRAIAVDSAAIKGIYTANIQRDRFLTNLAGTPSGSYNSPQTDATLPAQNSAAGSTGSGGRVSLPDYLLSE